MLIKTAMQPPTIAATSADKALKKIKERIIPSVIHHLERRSR